VVIGRATYRVSVYRQFHPRLRGFRSKGVTLSADPRRALAQKEDGEHGRRPSIAS